MRRSEAVAAEGVVTKINPGAKFEVTLDGGMSIRAHVSGKIRMNFVRIMVGDKVTVELSPYDLTKGRIVFRHK